MDDLLQQIANEVTAKLLLNSLYGKFFQKQFAEQEQYLQITTLALLLVILERLRSCKRCNGRGRYKSGITGEVVACIQCKGTGKING